MLAFDGFPDLFFAFLYIHARYFLHNFTQTVTFLTSGPSRMHHITCRRNEGETSITTSKRSVTANNKKERQRSAENKFNNKKEK